MHSLSQPCHRDVEYAGKGKRGKWKCEKNYLSSQSRNQELQLLAGWTSPRKTSFDQATSPFIIITNQPQSWCSFCHPTSHMNDDEAGADDTAEQQQQVDAAAAVRDAVVAARSVRSSNCERTYNSYHIWRVTWPTLPPSLKTLRQFVHELPVITVHWLSLKMRTRPQRMRRITWPVTRGWKTITFLESPTPICLFTIQLRWLYDEYH